MSEKNKKVSAWTKKLVSDLIVIEKQKTRSVVLAEKIGIFSTQTTVLVINEICRKAEERAPGYQEALFALIDIPAITSVLGYTKMSDIYLTSKAMGMDRVTRLLINPPPKKKRYSEYDFVEGQEVDQITLGMKRSLAKGLSKDTLDRLVYDPDPHVIRNLLNNPRLTERDALKVASRRPTTGMVLMEVFNSRKWIERYSIKRALVKNPFTPTGVALGLVNFMLVQDLKEISRDGTLHAEIRKAAQEILTKGNG